MRLLNNQDPMVKLAKKNELKWNLVKQVLKLEKTDSKDRQEFLLRNSNKQLATRIAALKPKDKK